MLQGMGEWCLSQPGPHPIPSRFVSLFQFLELCTGLIRRERKKDAECLPQIGLVGLVVLRPILGVNGGEEVTALGLRFGLAQQISQTRISGWRSGEPLPG